MTRRSVGLLLLGAGAFLATRPLFVRLGAQEQAPNRPEFTLTASDGTFSPARLEVRTGDLVKLTLESKDIAHSFAIDEYRIVRRIPAGRSTTFEFRADRAGTFRFYCNLSDGNHGPMEGQLVVRP